MKSSKGSKEDSDTLRKLVEEKPRNAKLMSRLACLLATRQSTEKFLDENELSTQVTAKRSDNGNDEAIYWANKAVKQAPQKPFGYSAIAVIHPNFDVRMYNLRKAILLSDGQDMYAKAMVGMLFQLLEDPRKEESKRIYGTTGKVNKIRRPLDAAEQKITQKLHSAIDKFWKLHSKNEKPFPPGDVEFVVLREYRLGLFFRKLEPSTVCRPYCRNHLGRVLQHLPKEHKLWQLAQFWYATVDEGETSKELDRCPKEYVVGLYSTFAENFDDLLVDKLSYQTPTMLRSLLNETGCINVQTKIKRLVDLGCGTGLSGLAFRDCTLQLDGVDLSPEMITKARGRRCYDKLVVGDCLDIFANNGNDHITNDETIDTPCMVIACDVFCYIGNLKPIFERVQSALEEGGIFAFSNELLLPCCQDEPDYLLHNCARFSHRQSYIERLAKNHGFRILGTKHAVIRKNQGKDVQGLLIVLERR